MHLSPMNLDELHTKLEITHELNRDAMLEKLVLITVSYFVLGTELRFQAKKDKKKQVELLEESDTWHSKAVRMACKFLPDGCPLMDHIVQSYEK